ncbi:MAG: bifunctional diaminohydroxyphosphoribosylaminopyrimidine deaminase/5-amino-6-(5-phosphoribosylamino)uracil reductase RibD [bacterium]
MKSDPSCDETFMRRALSLAAHGRYTTSPNPRVGAVIVSQTEPVVVGEGYHKRAGEPHAEILAIESAGEAARQSCLYVNLEPCCHHGRTPPCVDAILKAGISRVVVGMEDPFPEVGGNGIANLRAAGVQVDVGICEKEARELNRFFCSLHRRGRPWVILKMAMSLDGRIATRTGDSQWISCDTSRAMVHDLRAEVDAVLVGSETALHDRPHLTARPKNLSPGEFSQPRRIVLDTRGRLLSRLDCIQDIGAAPLEVLVGSDVEIPKGFSPGDNVKITQAPTEAGHIQPDKVLKVLARENALSVMIEGGQQVATSFLEAELVDELFLFIAPIVLGGSEAPLICGGHGVYSIKDALRLKAMTVQQVDKDVLIRGRFSDWP